MILDRKTAPAFGEISEFNFLPVEKIQSGNVVCHFINGGYEDVVRVDFIFNAGTKLQNKTCLAAATNSLLSEGTQKHSAAQIAEMFDSLGAFVQNGCSADDSLISLYCLSKHLDKCLEIVLEIFNEASFPENELKTYTNTQSQRLKVSEQKTSYQSRKAFYAALFGPNHPYGRSALAEDYLALESEDLKRFFRENYSRESLKIICSGRISEAVKTSVQKLAIGLTNEEKTRVSPNFTIAAATEKKLFIAKEKSVQSSIRIGRRLFDRTHEDYRPLQLLNLILGGYFGSRLMKNIREEKGLTYGIFSSLESYRGEGVFSISTDVNNNLRDLAIEEIYKEIIRLQNEPVSAEELKIAKNYLMGSFLRSLDGAFAQAERVKILTDHNLSQDYYDTFLTIIKETTATNLMHLANKHLKINDFYEVVCGG